jgi:hypothetical protein
MSSIKEYLLDENNRSKVIIISVTLAVIVIVGLIASSLIAGMTTPYIQETTTSSISTNTTTPITTTTKSQNLTTVIINNHTSITRQIQTTTFNPPTTSYPNPRTMTGYPKTVSINQLMFSDGNEEYYFKGFSGHILTIEFINNKVTQPEINKPTIGFGSQYTITFAINSHSVTLYMTDFNTLVITKVIK